MINRVLLEIKKGAIDEANLSIKVLRAFLDFQSGKFCDKKCPSEVVTAVLYRINDLEEAIALLENEIHEEEYC